MKNTLQRWAGRWLIGIELIYCRSCPQEKAEAPHKFVSETISVKMSCSVFVMDMEGKADGRALKTLLPHLNPKKLVSGAANVYSGRFISRFTHRY